jgi:hypothetical protein
MGVEPNSSVMLEDTWLDLELFRGSFPRSPASPAKVQDTIPPDPHQNLQSVNREVKRIERLQMRQGEEEVLSSGQQAYLHDRPIYDDRAVDAFEHEVDAIEDSESLEDEDGPQIADAYCMEQGAQHGGVFLKKYIPERDSFPALHDHLSALWDHRQTVASAMNLALEDDDVSHYGIYRDLFDQANVEMHEALQEGLRIAAAEDWDVKATPKDRNSVSRTDPLSSEASNRQSSSLPVQPSGTLPTSLETSNLNNVRWRGVDSLPLGASAQRGSPTSIYTSQDAFNQRDVRWSGMGSHPWGESAPKDPRKQSFKETDESFEVLFSYQGVIASRLVNENLPLKILYRMGRSYLETDFGFRVHGEYDFNLEFGDRLLTRSGVLSDVPLHAGSVIVVVYPVKPPISGEMPSIPTAKVDFHRESNLSPTALRNRDRPQIMAQASSANAAHRQPMAQTQSAHAVHRQSEGVKPERDGDELYDKIASPSLESKSYDKIRQNFKCPKFTGQARDWKIWDKGFWRYLSIWELEYVLDPSFFDVIPLSADRKRDNKLVYYIMEDAVQNSTLAASYIKQAPIGNGFEAYYTLHDGYVFAGSTTATLLLNELSNFRFLADESPTELCLRLDELFQELRDLPMDAAVTFIDTQKIGYLINALRHEKEWDYVCSAITSAQIKGGYTFREACNELKFRCESARANDLMDKPIKGRKVKGLLTKTKDDDNEVPLSDEKSSESVMSLISSMSKKLNTEIDAARKDRRKQRPTHPCLAVDCEEQTTFPLCPLHYHPLLSGKSQQVKLKSGYGDATYDSASQSVVYPSKVPENRLSKKQIDARKSVKVALSKAAGPQ